MSELSNKCTNCNGELNSGFRCVKCGKDNNPYPKTNSSALKKDTIEAWYFEKKEDCQKDNLENAIGYSKVESGVLKDSWGEITEFCYISSESSVG
jgi:methionyl-tRNA synthetase